MKKKLMDAALDQVAWKPVERKQILEIQQEGAPYATHEGYWEFFGHKIKCYQLSDGKRVFDVDDLERFFAG